MCVFELIVMCAFVCVYVPFKVFMHLNDFHGSWYERCASGGHLNATLLTGNNNTVDMRNCGAVTTQATHTSVAEMIYCNERDLGKIRSVL